MNEQNRSGAFTTGQFNDQPQYPPPMNSPTDPYGQPGVQQRYLPTTRPSPNWVLSVVSVLFNLIAGGIALYFSSQVTKRWDAGDFEGAAKASKSAKVAAIIGIVLGVIYIFMTLSSSGTSY